MCSRRRRCGCRCKQLRLRYRYAAWCTSCRVLDRLVRHHGHWHYRAVVLLGRLELPQARGRVIEHGRVCSSGAPRARCSFVLPVCKTQQRTPTRRDYSPSVLWTAEIKSCTKAVHRLGDGAHVRRRLEPVSIATALLAVLGSTAGHSAGAPGISETSQHILQCICCKSVAEQVVAVPLTVGLTGLSGIGL